MCQFDTEASVIKNLNQLWSVIINTVMNDICVDISVEHVMFIIFQIIGYNYVEHIK